jgi:hypothetical protein
MRDAEITFASAADRAAFSEELATSVAGLVASYHDATAHRGRPHRVLVAIHPTITKGRPTTSAKES